MINNKIIIPCVKIFSHLVFIFLKFTGGSAVLRSAKCGLFGDLFIVIYYLRLSEIYSVNLRIEWSSESLYFDELYENIFFELFGFCELKLRNYDFYRLRLKPLALDPLPYKNCSVRESISLLLRKYFRFNTYVMAETKKIVNDINDKFIGVHYRGTDARVGFENRCSTGYESFLQSVKIQCRLLKTNLVFVASDDQGFIEFFKSQDDLIVFITSATRSNNGMSLHGHLDGASQVNSALGRFTLAEQVLIDALVLSKSSHLVRAHSRVTCFSLSLNEKLKFTDLSVGSDIGRIGWLM